MGMTTQPRKTRDLQTMVSFGRCGGWQAMPGGTVRRQTARRMIMVSPVAMHEHNNEPCRYTRMKKHRQERSVLGCRLQPCHSTGSCNASTYRIRSVSFEWHPTYITCRRHVAAAAQPRRRRYVRCSAGSEARAPRFRCDESS
jgi:hypothetical protein